MLDDIFKNKKIIAGIVGLAMLVIVLFSDLYIIAEAHHDCTEHDCPVCSCIQQCENTLHKISDGLFINVAMSIITIVLGLEVVISIVEFTKETLVSNKVRLDN